MDVEFIFLAIFFFLSSSGVLLYCLVTNNHFVRRKIHYVIQAAFWLYLAVLSIVSLMNDIDTFGFIMNVILLIAGSLYGAYFTYNMIKDKGAFYLPFAKENNSEAMNEYGASIGANKILVSAVRPNKMDTILFTEVSDEEMMQIMDDIGSNDKIVMDLKSPEAKSKLFRSLIFVVLIIIIAII